MSKYFLFMILLLINSFAFADGKNENLLAVGQGISYPTTTSTINYHSGYGVENPVGVLYQNGGRASLMYDQTNNNNNNNNSSGYGLEFGYGQKKWGMALGYYRRNCNNCDGNVAGDVAVNISNVGVGIKFQENILGLGAIFNPDKDHRFGLMVSVDSSNSNSKVNAYGLGYSYAQKNFVLTLDGTILSTENSNSTSNNSYILSPGVEILIDALQLSATYKMTRFDNSSLNENKLWFGMGYKDSSWSLAFYSEYIDDIALVLSFYF